MKLLSSVSLFVVYGLILASTFNGEVGAENITPSVLPPYSRIMGKYQIVEAKNEEKEKLINDNNDQNQKKISPRKLPTRNL